MSIRRRVLFVTTIGSLMLASSACEKRQPAQQVESEPASTQANGPVDPVAESAAPPPAAAPHGAAPHGQAAATGSVEGTVIETMDSGGYTYLRLKDATSTRWAAGPITSVEVGDRVRLSALMPMKDFTSNTLGRTFAEIDFVEGIDVLGNDAVAAGAASALRGTVTETMDSGGYTYVQVETPDGRSVWAAGPATAVNVGADVSLAPGTPMTDFHSTTLDRTFDRIEFVPSIRILGAEDAAADAPSAAADGAPSDAPTGTADTAVEPLADGKRVVEIIDGRAALADTPVAVRGRVVKLNRAILDRDWLHIVDGSGDPAAGNHDLTVTTSDAGTVAVGDVVVVRGTLVLDQDFGSGYAYPVMVEGATLEVEPSAAE